MHTVHCWVSSSLLAFVEFVELEFEYIKQGFSHLMPDWANQGFNGLTCLTIGILETKKNLVLLNNLYPIMDNQLVRNDLLSALEEIESPVQSILASMEARGIAFNPKRLQKSQRQLETRIQELEEMARNITRDADFLLVSIFSGLSIHHVLLTFC